MKRQVIRLLPVLAVVAVLGQGRARADFADFSYHWSVKPASVIPGLPGSSGNVQLAITPDGTSSATVGNPTPTVIPGATVTTNTSATRPPDQFQTSFTMDLHLTDTASGKSGDLIYTGLIKGSLSTTVSTLTSTFSNPLTQQLTLGGHVYTATIDPTLVKLPIPGSSSPAMIDCLVTVAGGSTVQNTPEPSGLVLGFMAVSLVGCAVRRRIVRRLRPNT